MRYVFEDRVNAYTRRIWAKEGVTGCRVAEAKAAADYEARRQAAVADHVRQLPLAHATKRAASSVPAIREENPPVDDWQEVMDLAPGFSTSGARAYRRAGDRTRKLFNTAALDQVQVRDGHVVEAACKEPFDLLFSVLK